MGIFSSKTKVKVCVVGLDNSGKSTVLNQLKPKKVALNEVTPTVGFSTESFNHGNCAFTAFDMSGQSRYRELWQHYYAEATGIIFVVDSTDGIRMCVAADELRVMLDHPDTFRKPILFLSNKKDKPEAMSPAKVWDALKLGDIPDHAIQIQASDALRGEGITEGINWLSDQMTKK